GRRIRRRVVRAQPQPEPQGDHEPVAVAELQPDLVPVVEPHHDPASAAEEDDGSSSMRRTFRRKTLFRRVRRGRR
ncbi:hypothetical protein A2U01_0102184, partial [Trifolium medium]|nr:hypothetical protein [Trifolium medium]